MNVSQEVSLASNMTRLSRLDLSGAGQVRLVGSTIYSR